MSFIIKAAYIIVLGIYLIISVYLLVSAISSNTSAHGLADGRANSERHRTIRASGNTVEKLAVWKFDTPKNYDESRLRAWRTPTNAPGRRPSEEPSAGNGENGEPFSRINSSDPTMHRLMQQKGYNWLATETMSLHRSLPDYRCVDCRSLVYPKRLPAASIVIIFHNEAWSLLLRTIWSILDHSPPELIEEIILVDDLSTWAVLQRPIEDYIKLLPVPVLLLRTGKREGLIRARLIGADVARGNVLIFFDAHVEVTDGWLPPLLTAIADDRSVIATPHINWIDPIDFAYTEIEYSSRGFIGLNWFLNFTWSPIPEREIRRTHANQTLPIRIPTQIGCAIAVDRDFFHEIGTFDANMEIWGGENLEMALRVWQCGGSVLMIPCSHIGHLFRKAAYSFGGGDKNLIEHRNNVRILEMWLDGYKEFYYAIFPKTRNIAPGDLTERKRIKERLKCRSFDWYLANIHPDSTMFNDFIAIGEIKSENNLRCLDLYMEPFIGTYTCYQLGQNQFFAFTAAGRIHTYREEFCVGFSDDEQYITVERCNRTDDSQLWRYDKRTRQIANVKTSHCIRNVKNTERTQLGSCNTRSSELRWMLNRY